MTVFQLASVLVGLAGVFSYLNHRYLKMPTAIGVMLIALGSSVTLVLLGKFAPSVRESAGHLMSGIDFSSLLLHGMLAFLLFAASLKVKMRALLREWAPISALTALGTVFSAICIGGGLHLMLGLLGLDVGIVPCLLFGALISPTDAVAVLSIMKTTGAPAALRTQVAGESLFNDGVAVVLFLAILEMAHAGHPPTAVGAARMLLQEMGGGALLGFVLGYVAYRMLRSIDNYQVEVLVTVSLCMGVYALAEVSRVSAPVAVVLAGLLIGNKGRDDAMSSEVERHLDTFWELLDEIVNVMLFVLIGLEVLVMNYRQYFLLVGSVAIGIVLLARWISVSVIVQGLGGSRRFPRGTTAVLTWCGLRGGVSVAMALSLPVGPSRELFITTTYLVVLFSVVVQGLSIDRVIRAVVTRPPIESPSDANISS